MVQSSPITGGTRKVQTDSLAGVFHKDFVNQTRILVTCCLASFAAYRCCLLWFICASVKLLTLLIAWLLWHVKRRVLQIKVFVTFLLQQWLVIRVVVPKIHSSSSLQFPWFSCLANCGSPDKRLVWVYSLSPSLFKKTHLKLPDWKGPWECLIQCLHFRWGYWGLVMGEIT